MWHLRERRTADLPACVEILRVDHDAEQDDVHWPENPEDWLTPANLIRAFILEDPDGTIVGHLSVTSSSAGEYSGEQFFVTATARGTDAGRTLLDAAVDLADAVGGALSLQVPDNRAGAVTMSRRAGWRQTGECIVDGGDGTTRLVLEFRAPFSPLRVGPAEYSDAADLLSLRDAAARWQQGRGLHQWIPGELTIGDLHQQIDAGGMHVVRDGAGIAGAIRLLWADPTIWGHDPDDRAGYVHGLMTRVRGTGLGQRLLRWAEREVVRAGRSVIRLDCVSDNPALRNFYRQRGFREVGSHVFDNPRWSPVTTFEKDAVSG